MKVENENQQGARKIAEMDQTQDLTGRYDVKIHAVDPGWIFGLLTFLVSNKTRLSSCTLSTNFFAFFTKSTDGNVIVLLRS